MVDLSKLAVGIERLAVELARKRARVVQAAASRRGWRKVHDVRLVPGVWVIRRTFGTPGTGGFHAEAACLARWTGYGGEGWKIESGRLESKQGLHYGHRSIETLGASPILP
jgi:hypothetical protein